MVWIYTLNEVVNTNIIQVLIAGDFEIAGASYDALYILSSEEPLKAQNSTTRKSLTISNSSGKVNAAYREIILKDDRSLSGYDSEIAWLNENTVKSAPKTWTFYPNPTLLEFSDTSGQYGFTSNGNLYAGLRLAYAYNSGSYFPDISYYYNTPSYGWTCVYDLVYENENKKLAWTDQAYRTITFENAPTGELLEWLQKVAYPEGEKFVNRIVLSSGKTLIDLSSDTVTPETLAEGVIAHDKDGKEIVGTLKVT